MRFEGNNENTAQADFRGKLTVCSAASLKIQKHHQKQFANLHSDSECQSIPEGMYRRRDPDLPLKVLPRQIVYPIPIFPGIESFPYC